MDRGCGESAQRGCGEGAKSVRARRGRGEDAEPEVLLAQCVMAAGGAGQTREPSDNGWHARWLNVAAIVCAEDEAIAKIEIRFN